MKRRPPGGPSFVSIDFETANPSPDSACAIGIAVVRNGEVAERLAWLIRPPRLYFHPFFIGIHGITPARVAAEPTFDRVWREVAGLIGGLDIVAHNAAFDSKVMAASLRAYGLALPDNRWFCTVRIARRLWPGWPSYRLSAVAARMGISFRHHDAAEDAAACAAIAALACRETGALTLMELARRLKL